MATLRLRYSQVATKPDGVHPALSPKDFARFNTSLLALGDIAAEAKVINTVAAIVDLEGFTSFSKQIDPQLVVPLFLNDFLAWLFKAISDVAKKEEVDGKIAIWGNLPFFAKFLGDGVLFLWDTSHLRTKGIGNIAVAIGNVCAKYEVDFLPDHQARYSDLPTRLRVGIARGQVLSIGNGRDYVGACINMAARLQKLASLPFAVSRRGFEPDTYFGANVRKNLVTKKTRIRGIGDDELVIIRAADFARLSAEEKATFR